MNIDVVTVRKPNSESPPSPARGLSQPLCVGRWRLGDQIMKESEERYDALSVAVVVLVWMAFVEMVV